MKHSDECTAKPWTEWLIETGAEDVDDEDVPEIDPDGKLICAFAA
jgi:hypothetical protein